MVFREIPGKGGAIYSNLYATATVWGGGFLPSNFPNPNLKWEQDKSTNLGLDLHMFNNRVEVIADAYIKNISNLILPATGPSIWAVISAAVMADSLAGQS